MKYFFVFLSIIVFLSSFPIDAQAAVNPLGVPNNKYGIHIIDENDLENAASLVNSSGGDWGYVTIVIPDYERRREKWDTIFERMRQLHLIPIVRIATHVERGSWAQPQETDINEWVEFLMSLSWVTKNRYVAIFNEPNHAKEWGGVIDPEGYASLLRKFSLALKLRSSDFFVLPAALDASAPTRQDTMDSAAYLKDMVAGVPDVFQYVEGWNSHSYPNPGFSGTVTRTGKGTLTTYKWELQYLKTLGISTDFPVFITETGWAHREGTPFDGRYKSADTVADLVARAAEVVWNDPQIVAVTPFVLNYQSHPFSNFSWQLTGTNIFYPQFDSYRSIPKVVGNPILVPSPTPTTTVSPTPTVTTGQAQRVLSAHDNRQSAGSFVSGIFTSLGNFLRRLF